MKNVLIYRMQMFKGSEPFIDLQTRYLGRFRPIFAGRDLFGPPGNADYVSFTGVGRLQRLWHAVTRDPRHIAEQLHGRSIDLVHAHFGVDAIYAAPLARRLGVPLIVTLHGFDVTVKRSNLIRSGSPSLINYVMHFDEIKKNASGIICVSDFIKKCAGSYGLPLERLRTHYIGIDTAQFSRVMNHDCASRRVLHVARLVEKKGTRYLIEAIAKLRDIGETVYLDILGEGPRKAELAELAAALGIASQLKFHGQVSQKDVREFLQDSICLCLPSVTAANGDAEGLGMVLLEAAASGVPVVGTWHGGIPEAVIDGETGFLVREKSSDELADAIKKLTGNSELRATMSMNSRAMVEQKFDVRAQTKLLEDIYEAAISDYRRKRE